VGNTRQADFQLRWHTTELARILLLCAAAALAGALVTGRWQLVAFAAPMLGVLASVGWQRPVGRMSVQATPDFIRTFETEQDTLQLDLSAAPEGSAAALSVDAPAGMRAEVLDITNDGADQHAVGVRASADRWGRYPVQARVDVVAAGGLLAGTGSVDIADVFVFPIVPPAPTPLPRTDMLDRLGTHLTRYIGPGVEFADIRPYIPGDQLRTVNWAVSARRGSLHVTQRLTDRSMDVVVVVDLSHQPPGPASTATQRSVEGAVQVVQSALRNGDRAGVVGLGGQQPRWLGPDIGQRQFYRVLDTVLGTGAGYQTMTGTVAPRTAIPPGAAIVAFSTLLDGSFGLALIELSRRGHVVVVVDVLDGCPLGDDLDPIVTRMWALQRSAMYRDMRVVGVEVVAWPKALTLEAALQLMPDAGRIAAARRVR
jgi:uncharacterized protein (DUF58 family)